ncbi:MAG TPA: hypothetical protein VKZ53_27225 [Candidatus Angelobacter sp.]|nr:hypothetical protein [Candidatus Angelobacter sp.]
MAHTARNYNDGQEFWKPAIPEQRETLHAELADQMCERCHTGLISGSRYCYVCGADRHVNLADAPEKSIREWLDFRVLRDILGQTNASMVALFLGIACTVAAATTGLIYRATTLLDWQAVQLWRIQWLLAALAVFAAGLLLRKK